MDEEEAIQWQKKKILRQKEKILLQRRLLTPDNVIPLRPAEDIFTQSDD